MFTVLRSMFRDREGKVILLWAVAQITLGTVVYMWLEHWSPVDAAYFSVVTLATVGFGDLHPTTDAAKIFTIVYILFGLGILAAFISELTKHRAAVLARLRSHDLASVIDPRPVTADDDPDSPSTSGDVTDDR